MAVTLEWIRDNYDTNKNRYMDRDETMSAVNDFYSNMISMEQVGAVRDAFDAHTLLPAYGGAFQTLSNVTTLNIPTGATLKVDGVEVI